MRGFPIYLRWFAGLNVTLASRIADVGSGEGDLVARMSKHGFSDVWGFDPFASGDRDEDNAHIRQTGIEQAHGMFDVVMFNHSLEHVPDPIGSLTHAASRISKDGTVIVRVPLAGSYADRRYGRHWFALDPPRHLAVPSRGGMEAAAERVGLRIRRVFYDSLPQQFWGSEQYARDIALFDPTSGRGKRCSLSDWQRTRFLNLAGKGDRAGFVLTA